jgi:hypothetical protein
MGLFPDKQAKEMYEVSHAGFKLCFDPEQYGKTEKALKDVFRILHEEIDSTPLELLFLYDMDEQPAEELRSCDGRSNVTTTPEGEKYGAIGLSTQAIEAGTDYLQFLFIHELTHLMLPEECDHNEDYHSVLNYLLDKFNKATGKQLVNDYYGYNPNKPLRGHKARD